MQLTPTQEKIKAKALRHAQSHKKSIARRLTDTQEFLPEAEPVSLFMAGSPGAGKTETSIALLEDFDSSGFRTLRIDPDELRGEFEDYSGANSWLFQGAVSILVEKIHDLALKQKQSFILDGTLSNFDKAKTNIERSLKKRRPIQILYVYQKPQLAWDFVQKREKVEGRRILLKDFVTQYFSSRQVVYDLKREFGDRIKVDLLIKDNDGATRSYHANTNSIDSYIREKYNESSLRDMLSAGVNR